MPKNWPVFTNKSVIAINYGGGIGAKIQFVRHGSLSKGVNDRVVACYIITLFNLLKIYFVTIVQCWGNFYCILK